MIPIEIVTNMPNLRHLDVSKCKLSRLVPSSSSSNSSSSGDGNHGCKWYLPKLKILNLANNLFSEFLDEVRFNVGCCC